MDSWWKKKSKTLKEKIDYQHFFNNSIDMLCIANNKGYFVHVNNAFMKNLDYSYKDLINNPFMNFVHPDDIAKTQEEFKGLLNGATTLQFENRYKTKNGNYIWLSWKAIKASDIIYAIARNITPEKEIMLELHKKDEMLTHTERLVNVGTWDWNINTDELYWSEGVKKIFEETNVTFKNYMKTVHPDDLDYLNKTIESSIKNQNDYFVEHRVITKTKGIRYIQGYGNFIKQTDGLHLRGAVLDITEQKHIQENLKQTAERAKEASFLKSMFVANMSHEIRTPLNGIIGMTSILEDLDSNNSVKECIQHIKQSSGVLLSIVNKVLDFSKIESGKMEIHKTRINFPEFIEEIKNHFCILCRQQNLTFIVKVDEQIEIVECDKTKIQQILYNLIGNALKFTTEGRIVVEIRKILEENQQQLHFMIKDTGIGIDSEIQKQLFNPFVQGDNSKTKKFQGTGLGLSICKKLIELMGGSISVESTLGVGSCFTFLLPIKFLNHPIRAIVIAEDNHINQIVIKKVLEKMGFNSIVIYEDGIDIVESLKEKRIIPDMIFMDIHMPRMNGLEATQKIRELGITVPIIAITANAIEGIKEQCLSAGMNDILLKPYQTIDLERMVNKWLVQII